MPVEITGMFPYTMTLGGSPSAKRARDREGEREGVAECT